MWPQISTQVLIRPCGSPWATTGTAVIGLNAHWLRSIPLV